MVSLIWAQDRAGVIGRAGTMPWHLPEDLAHFKRTTADSPVIMGRRTWDSLPPRFRPLPGRRNIVVTRDAGWASPGATVVHDFDAALTASGDRPPWVIGGAEIFALALPHAERCVVTEIDLDVAGDTHAPELGGEWSASTGEWQTSERSGLRYRIVIHTRHRAS